MHLITKTQLSSVEEDNQRLRTQLQLARKRTSAPEERYWKNTFTFGAQNLKSSPCADIEMVLGTSRNNAQ